jgi:choline dehydrogenase-like flavoprotein
VDSARVYDTVIIGSGFGGSMVAQALVNAGERVLMLERGDWVRRGPENWAPDATFVLTPHYTLETPYRLRNGGYRRVEGLCACVGGLSVFYGGVSLRFRRDDFAADPAIVGESGAEWPLGYDDLEPYYSDAEQLLGVAGEAGLDPTEPPRSQPYPQPAPPASPLARRVEAAARQLGLHPFPLPLAINSAQAEERACLRCTTCDGFACAVSAKNDLATTVLPPLLRQGLELRPNTVAVRLVQEGTRVTAVDCVDRVRGTAQRFRAGRVVLAAGALASPHLLLASGLERVNPGGHTVGRYLMRHCNAFVYGLFTSPPNPTGEYHKQLAIHDFYFGHPDVRQPVGKLGNIQQVMAPPASFVRLLLPRPVGAVVAPWVEHGTGLIVIAEDQPQYENRVELDWRRRDRFLLPQLVLSHRYTRRDRAARAALVRAARRILKTAGAIVCVSHAVRTFSHALGTVRMGRDPGSSALDEYGRFRGLDNLYVTDASALPRSAGVNPSLTVAANALRIGEHLASSRGSAAVSRLALLERHPD